jgi:patatin-like phospholipase/acyl hydrolase
MSNKIDSAVRLKYIRVLERFLRSVISYLSIPEGITKEGYNKKIENNLKYFQKTQSVALYKGEFSDLESLVKEIIAKADSDNLIEDIKCDILYKSNKLEKTKNNRKYKKDKHKTEKFNEW